MTAGTNIQMADHGTIGEKDHNKEAVIMKFQSNIQNIFKSNIKVFAGIVIGGMVMAASILPVVASADSPARPASVVSVGSSVAGIESLYANDSDLRFPSLKRVTGVGIESLYANDSDLQFPSVRQATGMDGIIGRNSRHS